MINCFSPISLGESVKKVATDKFVLTETTHPPNRILPQHYHQHPNLSLVLSGSFTESVHRNSLECGPQSLLIKPAGEPHSNQYGRKGVRCLVIEVLPRWIELLHPWSKVFDAVDHIQRGVLSLLAMRIYKEFRSLDSASMLAMEGLLLEIMAEASRRSRSVLKRKPPNWLEQAKEMIHGHFPESLSLTALAEAVGVHPVHLAREFRNCYRCTIGEYVRNLRIEFACREISTSNASLFQIALAAGFSDHSHFSRTFRQLTGMTPAEYRKVARSR